MGCFDTVFIKCPKCNTKVSFQSKAGSCSLKKYRAENCPRDIAESLMGKKENCPKCNEVVAIGKVNHTSVDLSRFVHIEEPKDDAVWCGDDDDYNYDNDDLNYTDKWT